MDSLRIGLDWDGTVTADRGLWFSFIRDAVARGHCVYIVTARPEEQCVPVRNELRTADLDVQVISTGAKPKIAEVDRQIGHFMDIWIEDMPQLLFASSAE